jgi:RNA polymerase subunit RPABC4/transcription elongation factor Spt4
MFIAWALFGALLGVAASQKRGFSLAGGILGGLLLGPLAFLLFFVSGITKGDTSKTCPHCAEFIKPEAKVCKHCGRDVLPPAVTPRPPRVSPPSGDTCSKCGHLMPANAARCAKCMTVIPSAA